MLSCLRKYGVLAIACMAIVACCASPALAQTTLSSDVTADVADYVPLVASKLSTVVVAVLAVFFAFLAIRFGIRWARSFGAG